MRNREVIANTLVDYLKTSSVIANVTKYRVYPHWRDNVPVVNVTDDGEEIDEIQALGGYIRRNLDLVFEVITITDDALSKRNEYDLEIERLLAIESNPIDQLEDSLGQNFKVDLMPISMEAPEPSGEGDTPTITTRIHYECKYFEKAGGTA